MGFKKEAIKLLEYIYSIPGVDNYHRANSLIQRAFLLIQSNYTKKSIDKALKYLAQAKLIYPTISNSMNDVVANYNNTMSHIQQNFNNDEKALELINANIVFWKSQKITKTKVIKMVGLYTRLGDIYSKKESYTLAIKNYNKGIEFYNENNTTNIKLLLTIKNNLAVVFRKIGRYEKAVILFEENRSDSQKYLGIESNDYITNSVNLASAYLSLGNIEKSIEINNTIAEIIVKKYGKQSIQYLTFNNNLTIILQNAQKYHQAELHYKENIKIAKKILGETHSFTFLSQGNLSELLYLSGQPQKSIKLVLEILPLATKELGENDISVQLMKESLAWSYHLIDKDELALPIINQVVKSLTKTFDKTHDLTQHANKFLAIIKKNLNKK